MRASQPLTRICGCSRNGNSIHGGKTPLPRLWLISDARNDDRLEDALSRMARGSGFIYRHYHLPMAERRARFDQLAKLARKRGICIILSGEPALARQWRADGMYGPAASGKMGRKTGRMIHLATAHNLRDIGRANRAGADGVLLSPVFPTRSHPGTTTLGPVRFHLIARYACMPVLALGGMTMHHARRLRWPAWAAIDGLSAPNV